jgi:hypothetical protein
VNAFLIALTILVSTSALSAWRQGTTGKQDNIYQKVPEEQREALKQAVEKLVAAEKVSDWKAVYDLLDKRPDETKDAFVNKMSHMRVLREFRPVKVTFMPPDESWNIEGCASLAGEHNSEGHVANLTARWKNSCWYLSVISFVPFGNEKGGKLKGCSIQ